MLGVPLGPAAVVKKIWSAGFGQLLKLFSYTPGGRKVDMGVNFLAHGTLGGCWHVLMWCVALQGLVCACPAGCSATGPW